MLCSLRYHRNELDRTRSTAHHDHPLASEVSTVIPLSRMEHLTPESFHSRYIRNLRVVQCSDTAEKESGLQHFI